MALQTLTHPTENEPTVTVTDGYPPPPSRPPGPPPPGRTPNSNSFTPAGSPPLILAFLAIGLFSVAMIVVFGWRRIQLGRSWNLNNVQNLSAEALAQKELLARKPKLWDLWTADTEAQGSWTEKEKGVAIQSAGWVMIMPLSAKAVSVDDEDAENSIAKGTAEPPPRPPPTSLALGLRAVGAVVFKPISRRIEHLWRRNRPTRPPSEKTDDPTQQPPRQATLCVEVAILMPSPDYPVYVGSARDEEVDEKELGKRGRNEITDYAIGLYKCPWDM